MPEPDPLRHDILRELRYIHERIDRLEGKRMKLWQIIYDRSYRVRMIIVMLGLDILGFAVLAAFIVLLVTVFLGSFPK